MAKKSHNLINIITGISVVGVGVGAFALIVVLSVFNGFEVVISSMVNAVSPDLLIESRKGKVFDATTFPLTEIAAFDGVRTVTQVIEEDALLRYDQKQHIGRIKGVGAEYQQFGILDSLITDGVAIIENKEINFAIAGAGVAWYLGMNLHNPSELLQVYVPQRGNPSSFSIDQGFRSEVINVSGVFSSQQDFDVKYVYVPLNWARKLLDYENEITAVEVFTKEGVSISKIKKQIKQVLGESYVLKDKFEQQETLYKIMRSEKWAIFIILTFILIMATFNVIGSLTMLIVDKQNDISILRQLGTSFKSLKQLFLTEGLLISIAGGLFGLLAGILLILLQQEFGLLKLGGGSGSFVIDAYPVQLKITDILAVFFIVVIIGGLSSVFTVTQSMKKLKREKE